MGKSNGEKATVVLGAKEQGGGGGDGDTVALQLPWWLRR